jgi:mitogen-activated protein kinase kinase
MEEDEEAAEAEAAGEILPQNNDEAEGFVDREVGEWVIEALDKRKRGVMGKGPKPALHAAPLDATGVASPLEEVKAPVAVDA